MKRKAYLILGKKVLIDFNQAKNTSQNRKNTIFSQNKMKDSKEPSKKQKWLTRAIFWAKENIKICKKNLINKESRFNANLSKENQFRETLSKGSHFRGTLKIGNQANLQVRKRVLITRKKMAHRWVNYRTQFPTSIK